MLVEETKHPEHFTTFLGNNNTSDTTTHFNDRQSHLKKSLCIDITEEPHSHCSSYNVCRFCFTDD